jgi:hypothetical protein
MNTERIRLQFGRRQNSWQEKPKKMRDSVSALVQWGDTLWVASDQTATVERLVADDATNPTRYDGHRSFRLRDFVPLPEHGIDEPDQEVDLEGMDLEVRGDVGDLWLVGSHSHARGKGQDGVEQLGTVVLDRNRCALMRIPVVRGNGGPPELVPVAQDARCPGQPLTAGVFVDLMTAVAKDDFFAPFFHRNEYGVVGSGVPGKDNGLDIEGLAVVDGSVFLGLRGPVLRGWAVVLRLEVDPALGEEGELRVRPAPDGAAYRRYFLPLGGLGVRDLLVQDRDLLVLAGPTMDLDGPVRIHRWIGGAAGDGPPLVASDRVPVVRELRATEHLRPGEALEPGTDHPEAIAWLATGNDVRLLVADDSPAPYRTTVDGAVDIDILAWP